MRFVIICLCVIGSMIPLAAELAPVLKKHPVDLKRIVAEAGDMKKLGYYPVGIDAVEKGPERGVYVLYRDDKFFEFEDWQIVSYPSVKTLEEVMIREFARGWIGIDFASAGNAVFVLYMKMRSEVDTWLLQSTAIAEDVENSIRGYYKSGYRTYGIMNVGDDIYFTMIRLEKDRYQRNETRQFNSILEAETGIVPLMKDSWDVWGFYIATNRVVFTVMK
ncbi:MAG: hypothetical protein HZC28_08985 [Spirochaetes bacterium]|nr:hypothetical protein [Spirochaetota bacterium]